MENLEKPTYRKEVSDITDEILELCMENDISYLELREVARRLIEKSH